jgi:hypothetical protein
MDDDQSYKLLFSHAEMVADLLRGFVREGWVRRLDFGSLERVGGSYAADDLREREDDVIWRVRFGDEWLYVYLLIEFQSTVDRFMAVRILVYLGFLYQELIRAGQLNAPDLLPRVVPVVLYEGVTRWDAPEDVGELMETVPGRLGRSCPQLRYLLPEEGRYSEGELAPLRDVATTLLSLENGPRVDDVQRALDVLTQWLQRPEEDSLEKTLTTWLTRSYLPRRMPGVDFSHLKNLQEVLSMLDEHAIEWTEQWKREGLEKG